MSRAQLIKPSGVITEIQPSNGKNFTLQECYSIINCTIVERVGLADGRIMLLDEEGKLKDEFEKNAKATELFMKDRPTHAVFVAEMKAIYGDKFIDTSSGNPELDDVIVGTVIVCDPEMFQ